MKITSLVQNTIAICCCILVFIIAFIWIAFHFNDSTNAFKDSLNIGASFFSGIATLAAAYIASKLVSNWKDQTKYNEQLKCLAEVLGLIDAVDKEFYRLRHNENVFQYLKQFFEVPQRRNTPYFKPDFKELDFLIQVIRTNFSKIEMYYNYQDKFIFSESEESNSFFDLQNNILMWKLHIEAIEKFYQFDEQFISRAFDCNVKIYDIYGKDYPNIKLHPRYLLLRTQLNLLKNDCEINRIRLEKNYE